MSLIINPFSSYRQEIISSMDHRAILKLFQTNRELTSLEKDPTFWRELIVRDFGPKAIPRELSYCQIAYKINHLIVEQLLKNEPWVSITIKWDPPSSFQPTLEVFHFRAAFEQIRLFPELNPRESSKKIMAKFKEYLYLFENRNRAFEGVIELPNRMLKIWALGILSDNFRDGGIKLKARKCLRLASEEALLISDTQTQNEYLLGIIDKHFENHDLPRALKVASRIPDLRFKSFSLLKIFKIYMERKNFVMAEKVASEMPDETERSSFLMKIFEQYLFNSDLDSCEKIILTIPNDSTRTTGLVKIINQYLEKHDLVNGERVALLIPDDRTRERVLEEISLKYIETGQPFDAERVISNLENEKSKSELLTRVANHYLLINDFESAKRVVLLIPNKETSEELLALIKSKQADGSEVLYSLGCFLVPIAVLTFLAVQIWKNLSSMPGDD
jgi:hypothetical protein